MDYGEIYILNDYVVRIFNDRDNTVFNLYRKGETVVGHGFLDSLGLSDSVPIINISQYLYDNGYISMPYKFQPFTINENIDGCSKSNTISDIDWYLEEISYVLFCNINNLDDPDITDKYKDKGYSI